MLIVLDLIVEIYFIGEKLLFIDGERNVVREDYEEE